VYGVLDAPRRRLRFPLTGQRPDGRVRRNRQKDDAREVPHGNRYPDRRSARDPRRLRTCAVRRAQPARLRPHSGSGTTRSSSRGCSRYLNAGLHCEPTQQASTRSSIGSYRSDWVSRRWTGGVPRSRRRRSASRQPTATAGARRTRRADIAFRSLAARSGGAARRSPRSALAAPAASR
jgi:hypothetical protein